MTRAGLLLALLMILTTGLRGGEPENGKLYRESLPSGATVNWILTGNPGTGWRLRVTNQQRALVDAKLGNCMFCAGEEDNCGMNGIFVREIAGIDTPLVLAVCHVGAHSQQLQLFDPGVSRDKPALRLTGSYYLDWSLNDDGGLVLEWDGDANRVPGCKVLTDNSHEMAPAQNRLVIDAPCYRSGSPPR